jgi:creatinine amidohydrolase
MKSALKLNFSTILFILLASSLCAQNVSSSQKLPVAWEELTSSDFSLAVKQSDSLCIIPIGVIEKHGQHLPMGTDVFTSRYISIGAASKEYAVVFPFYYAAQIFEAMHQPGTIAYSEELLYKILEETCKEISRNGLKKILIVNGHGGNTYFLQYFCQTMLAKKHDFSVYLFTPSVDSDTQKKISSMRKSTTGGHADESEASTMLVVRPELVKMERASIESGEDQKRLVLPNAYSSIGWYSKYPNHYAGDAKDANAALGEVILNQKIRQLFDVIKTIKADKTTMQLQREFWGKASSPVAR